MMHGFSRFNSTRFLMRLSARKSPLALSTVQDNRTEHMQKVTRFADEICVADHCRQYCFNRATERAPTTAWVSGTSPSRVPKLETT
jgi:hypothetical protein